MKKFFPVLQYMNIPNGITTLGLIFGIAACYFLTEGNLQGALICLAMAMLMDLCDGFFADKLNQQTRFGRYADTLVDFFICCIMPVLIVYTFVGSYFILVLALMFYCVCGMWRLAYYNVIDADDHFVGLPVPGAMLLVTMVIWSVVNYGIPSWFIYLALFVTGLLMVSFIKLQKYGFWQKALWVMGLLFLAVIVIF